MHYNLVIFCRFVREKGACIFMFYKDVSTIFSSMFFRYVMQELVETERDYVKDLGLVVEVSVVWTCHTFENIFKMKHKFAKYLKESCR